MSIKKRVRTPLEQKVDRELIGKGGDVLREFDQAQALHVPAKRQSSKLISLRLPIEMLRELRDAATRRGDIGYQQIIKIYLTEGLEREGIAVTSCYMWLSGSDYPHPKWTCQTFSERVEPLDWVVESINQGKMQNV